MNAFDLSALTRPGSLSFLSNLPLARDPPSTGVRMVRWASGHLVFYGPHNRRVLATDPDGNPLHECEWIVTAGRTALARARLRLDWEQWIGLKPGGFVNSTMLDLSRKPGWERLRADDLRRMAAQALHVPLEEVRFFFNDEDLVIDPHGRATIRHRKDAFYVLDQGTFDAPPEQIRFMSCMGAMHWDRIDFLPVVELFQSLLPGTGSAAFEFIRGLYDDQNETTPVPLRYRGIPTYPSEAAFRLFSGVFTPQVPGGGAPYKMFMDPSHAHQVLWLPAADPPRRHFDSARRLCVTIQGETVTKATLADDPAGLSYLKPNSSGFAPCERAVTVSNGQLILQDRDSCIKFSGSSTWGVLHDSAPIQHPSLAFGWRSFFGDDAPAVEAVRAYSSVLLYPDDDTEIAESSSQPFVADHLQDAIEQHQDLARMVAGAEQVLIENFDATITTCYQFDRPRHYTVLYRQAEFAQKHAQLLWNRLAQSAHLEWGRQTRFSAEITQDAITCHTFDLAYRWIAFSDFMSRTKLDETIHALALSLKMSGLAFVVGPHTLSELLPGHTLRLLHEEPVESLPTFRMHQTILPKGRLKSGLTLYYVIKD